MAFNRTTYYDDLRGRCPMGVQKWRALKGLAYVLIMAFVALVGIIEEGPVVAVAFIIGAVVVFGAEISEIQIADWVSIQFEGEAEVETADELPEERRDGG